MSKSGIVVPFLAAGGGSGRGLGSGGDSQGADGTEVRRGGLVRGGLVRGLGGGIPFAWMLISKSDSVIPFPATGGGSGRGLGSWGDSQGVVGTEVHRGSLVRGGLV